MELTLEKLAEKIEKENKKFDKLTPAKKRVVIAQDCLSRIGMGLFNPHSGSFVNMVSIINESNDSNISSIKELINTIGFPQCNACAKGGLFLSYVGRVNNFDVCDMPPPFETNEPNKAPHLKLLEIFSIEQLGLIECAFEGEFYLDNLDIDADTCRAAIDFYENFTNEDGEFDNDEASNKRMIAICENIIKNKGTFKP